MPQPKTTKSGKPEAIVLDFTYEKDTPNKKRFQELEPADGGKLRKPAAKGDAIIEKIYISKKLLKDMGDPDMLTVTISAP